MNRLKAAGMAGMAVLMAQAGGGKSSGGGTAVKKPEPQAGNDDRSLPSTAIDFSADAGKGMEGVDKDSRAIPFLIILQPQSPIILDGKVEGAKPGHIANSVTSEVYGESCIIIPCAFQRRFIRWAPRDSGGGFKGEFTVAQVQEMRQKGEVKEVDNRLYFPLADGSINEKKCDKLSDTRSHFVMVMRNPEEKFAVPMVLSLTSTAIKISKQFISRIDGIKLHGKDGMPFTPPSFSHMYRVNTVKKTNDGGTWWIPDVEMVGPVKDGVIYNLAKGFHSQVSSGSVMAAHDSVARAGGGSDDGGSATEGF